MRDSNFSISVFKILAAAQRQIVFVLHSKDLHACSRQLWQMYNVSTLDVWKELYNSVLVMRMDNSLPNALRIEEGKPVAKDRRSIMFDVLPNPVNFCASVQLRTVLISRHIQPGCISTWWNETNENTPEDFFFFWSEAWKNLIIVFWSKVATCFWKGFKTVSSLFRCFLNHLVSGFHIGVAACLSYYRELSGKKCWKWNWLELGTCLGLNNVPT